MLTLPIVMAAIWGVLLTLAHFQRHQFRQVLAAQVTSGSVKEATAALVQIAGMPNPPLDILVSAAASPAHSVAQQAQRSIGELLRKWNRHLRAERHVSRIAHQLEQLAEKLARDRELFTSRDYPWLAKTTESIIRLANAAPPKDAPRLALHCDTLLALANPPIIAKSTNVIPATSNAVALAPERIFHSPAQSAVESLVSDILNADDLENDDLETAAGQESPATSPATERMAITPPLRWSEPSNSKLLPAPLPSAEERHFGTNPDAPGTFVAPESSPPVSADPWSRINSRPLFERWLAASGAPKLQIAHELERRGFGVLRADVVRLALSSDTDGRVQLVHDLLSLPGQGTKAWLLLFADDADAEVRLAAVTVMATSRDQQLLEKAWQVALHDRDPRIASLAERLRDLR